MSTKRRPLRKQYGYFWPICIRFPQEHPINLVKIRSGLFLFTSALIWGLTFIVQRQVVEYMGAFTFNGIRFLLGGLLLLPLAIFYKPPFVEAKRDNFRSSMAPGLILGTILFLAANLQQWGIETTTAGKAAFLTGLYIILVPIVGIFFKQRANPGVWLGAVLGVTGLGFLSLTDSFGIGFGDSLQIIGALFWTAHIMFVGHWSQNLNPFKLSITQYLFCGAFSLIWGITFEQGSWHPSSGAIVPILVGGLGSVGIAYTLQIVGQRNLANAQASIILSLETVVAAVGGYLILNEQLIERQVVGCVLMFVGMLLAQIWPSPKATKT